MVRWLSDSTAELWLLGHQKDQVNHQEVTTLNELVPMSEAAVFDLVQKQATVLADSQIVPSAYRRRSPDIVAAGLAGRAYGWDVMTALRQFHVIEGTASLKPEAMLGLVRQAGHSVTIERINGDGPESIRVVATGERADTGDRHVSSFSMADATAAGLSKRKTWQQYRDDMLQWRAVTRLCRALFPDVVLGAGYTPEEVGAENIDAEGVPIDIIDVEVIEDTDGFVPRGEAKTQLLDLCDGDKKLAAAIWGDRDQVTEEELVTLCESAEELMLFRGTTVEDTEDNS